MSEIGIFTPEQSRLLWQDYLKRQQLDPSVTTNVPHHRPVIERTTQRLQVKLKAALAKATNTLTAPATAQAYVLVKNADGDMVQTTDEIEIVNRFANISLLAATYAKAEWIDGEWQLYAADCEA